MADKETWWVIEQSELLSALRRCSAGEDPDVMLLELTANSDVETVDRSEEDER